MCNLFSVTKDQSAIRNLFRVSHDRVGNLPTQPAIFPDQMAPIVRVGPDGKRELVALGNARASTIWRRADHEHPQRQEPGLAALAREGESLRRAGNVPLQIRGHQAS
jgi:putative SOS response-associated peptidase YedK